MNLLKRDKQAQKSSSTTIAYNLKKLLKHQLK